MTTYVVKGIRSGARYARQTGKESHARFACSWLKWAVNVSQPPRRPQRESVTATYGRASIHHVCHGIGRRDRVDVARCMGAT